MTERSSQTIRRRRLAGELRRLRERAGLTGDEAADRLGWSGSKISRIELNRIGVKQTDVKKLLDLYGVGGSHREDLLDLARESRESGWLELVTANFPPEFATYISGEAEARSLWNWEPQIVPGLLQTEDYARALMKSWQSALAIPPGEIDRRVEARRIRQEALIRENPLEFSAVFDESVLYRKFGSNEIMRRQMNYIAQVAELPNVAIQVLPLDSDKRIATGAFTYLKFPSKYDIPANDMVTVEHLTGSYYFEIEGDTYSYLRAFELLRDGAYSPEESRRLLIQVAEGAWS